MYWKLFKNDIKNNLLQTFSIALFIVLSVAFLAAAGQLTIRLAGSVSHLFEAAETPHLLQMHTGEMDFARMDKFAESRPEIEEYQILSFLNVDNTDLAFNGNTLKDSVYDNGFSVQSPHFDYLLDLKGSFIRAKKGEVYAPVFYLTSGLAKEGDILSVQGHRLKVAGFVRDSQMNSSLSVSKRFIISEEDFAAVKDAGTLEYLIEFRLNDLSKSAEVEAAYAAENLESDGPPFMTYTLFKLVNAFSDGITIVTLLFISILIIGISLLCIRFTLLAKLEEDYRELAVLKAIGIPFADIRRLFLGKYLFIAGGAAFLGFLLSFLIRIPLLENMKVFFGDAGGGMGDVLGALILSLGVFGIICLSMGRLAKRLKKPGLLPPSEEREAVFPGLFARLPRKLHLALCDLPARRKVYWTMVMVFTLSVFILNVPASIYSTVSDKSFVNYLGLGTYDIRIDLVRTGGREQEIRALFEELEKDPAIAAFDVFTGKLVDYKTETGSVQKMWINFGNQESFPIRYAEGQAPVKDNEISLSKLKADDLSKKTGDTLTLIIDGKEKQVVISGIFSDLTNGGKTAKASFQTRSPETGWLIVPIELKEGAGAGDFIGRYRSRYPFAKFSDTQTYLGQIFGNTIAMIGTVTRVAFAASVFLIFLIAALFIRMLYLKDLGQNALLKSIGFRNRDIRIQYFIKTGVILAAGLLAGNLLAWSAGDQLGSGILSLIGIHGVRFIRNPVFSYMLVPAVLFVSAVSAARFGIGGLKRADIAQLLKEDI